MFENLRIEPATSTPFSPKRPQRLAVCIATLFLAGAAEARDLTTEEQANVHSYLTIINDNLSGQTGAKNSLDTLLRDSTVALTSWNSTFANYFDSHLLKDRLANYLDSAPLDSNESVEYRKRFQTATISGASQRLRTRIEDAGGLYDLGLLMNDDCVVREDVLQALELLNSAASGTNAFVDLTPGSVNIFYDGMKNFVQNVEPALAYDEVYTDMFGPTATQPWAGPIRARLLRAIRHIKPTDTTGRDFSTDFSVPTQYAEILDDHGTMVQDNGEFILDGRLGPLRDLLESLPATAEKPTNIAVKELFGNVCPVDDLLAYPPTDPQQGAVVWNSVGGCSMGNLGWPDGDDDDSNPRCLKIGVNVHDTPVTGLHQTLFPQDESSWEDPQQYNNYCHTLAHEVSHALRPESDSMFVTRETAAIERACAVPLNYLRSKSGSFCGNGVGTCTTTCEGPGTQEFFAYISQMYFMDTEKSLKVAHQRFACREEDSAFHKEPLNQFLLFANVIADSPTGTATIPFYQALDGTPPNFTNVCDLTPDYFGTITRNSNGCITTLSFTPPGQAQRNYSFTISSTNPTHCVVSAITSPTFSSVYPSDSCPQ